jgi:DNA adenine methylase
MTKTIKPLISYYGGKQRIASWICQYIPKHTVYAEPFCGGAAVFFMKPFPKVKNNNHYREVLNDTNKAIVTLYKVASDKILREEFLYKLQCTPYSRSVHKEACNANTNKYKGYSELDIAVAFYININMSFAKNINGGWGTSVYGRNSAGTWANRIKNLPSILERLFGVHIEHDDALSVIKRWDSPQTFFYCDPPYVGSDQGHYKGYTEEDFKDLIGTLESIQGSFLLSHYHTPSIEIPSNWERFEKDTVCSSLARVGYDRNKKQDESSQNRKRTEVLYRKLASVEPRPEIKKLYATGAYDCFPAPGFEGSKDDNFPLFS